MEFALVTAAFLAMVIAGGVVWRTFSGGILVDHALTAASHHVLSGLKVMADVFSY